MPCSRSRRRFASARRSTAWRSNCAAAGAAAWPVQVSARPAGSATWLTLVDAAPQRRAERLGELLNMAQQFGRLGVWERDLRTLQGRWDRHVHRFWGLPADAQVPDFAQAAAYVVPEDREALASKFLDSIKAGRRLFVALPRARRRRRVAPPALAMDGEERRRRPARARGGRHGRRHRGVATWPRRWTKRSAQLELAVRAGRHRDLAPRPAHQSPALQRPRPWRCSAWRRGPTGCRWTRCAR